MLVMCERTLVAVVELWNCCREESSSYLDIIIFRNSIARIFAVGTTVGSLLFVFFSFCNLFGKCFLIVIPFWFGCHCLARLPDVYL